MNAPRTVLEARPYWETYYADTFRFGQGTEHILDLLYRLPPLQTWTDLGSGSESLLWAIPLDTQQLTAVDTAPDRLTTLTEFARAEQPRGIHQVALALYNRAPKDFIHRCRTLKATVVADCLTPGTPPARLLDADLITQFGLLGLCRDIHHFTETFARLHSHLPPHGWAAGANWTPAEYSARIHLTPETYRHAAHRAHLQLLHLQRHTSTDSQFPDVWTYLARRTPR